MTAPPFAAIACFLLTAGTDLAADVDIKEVTAVSQNGEHRLRLTKLEQTKSPWDEKVCAVSMTFQLEFAQKGEIKFLTQAPENVYLEAEDPLVEGFLLSGENVATNKHSGWTDQFGSTVTIHTLEVGKEQKQLQKLKLALTLVKVTEWEEVEFKGLKEGDNGLLHCSPFELACKGEVNRVTLTAAVYWEFYQEHERYQKQMPLKFQIPRHAMDHASMTDARNRPLYFNVGLGCGGSMSGGFSLQRFLNFDTGTRKKDEEPIAYPIAIKFRLPKRYETERVTFEFDSFDLPALK